MKFETRTIKLKDGRECILQPTTAEFAQEMIDYLKITSAETPFLLRNPDEVIYSPEQEKQLLEGLYKDERSVMMLALVDGEIAGNCSINGIGKMRRISHRCSFAIALKKAYWGLGIGTALMRYAEELSKTAGYEQIELEVVEGNDAAKRLYEKMGFTETGKHVNAMKYDDGTYCDEILMAKNIK